jgi:hypothetical protein
MAVSIAHKLRALRDLLYPDLRFQVHAPAVTPSQVRHYGLPSTPLKDTEKRADRWKEAFGVEQTEVDAMISLRPGELTDIAETALAPFFDATLERRTARAQRAWTEEANARLDAAIEDEEAVQAPHDRARDALIALGDAAVEAETACDEFREAIAALSVEFPAYVTPQPDVAEDEQPPPLISSEMSFATHAARLRARKAYQDGE